MPLDTTSSTRGEKIITASTGDNGKQVYVMILCVMADRRKFAIMYFPEKEDKKNKCEKHISAG
jgi:hypothetical protein